VSKQSKLTPKPTSRASSRTTDAPASNSAVKPESASEGSVGTASPALNFLDRFAAQLAGWPRGARVVIAGLITLVITGLVGMLLFSVLFQIPAQRLTWWFINPSNISVVVLTALVVVGIAMYWVSWSVLVGFDFGTTPLVVGRAGAVWVLFGLLALCAVIALVIISTAIAVQEQ